MTPEELKKYLGEAPFVGEELVSKCFGDLENMAKWLDHLQVKLDEAWAKNQGDIVQILNAKLFFYGREYKRLGGSGGEFWH